ncbi:MAG: DnaD domain protein [Candidatus Fimimonas sp.]
MAFCDKEKQLIDSGVTVIDNKFILNFLPDAPDKCVAVYLLGLTLTESGGADNSCETIARKTNLSQEEVMAAFLYWEELGLVHITADNPPKVLYLSMRDSVSTKKIKASKYTKFNKDMQSAIEGRMLTPNEFNEYYTFLEDTTFQPEALVAVAKYCVALKGKDINYRYILTVARNQLAKGATTLEVVQDNLNSQQKYDEDLKLVFKALGLTRKFDHQDRELYEKWTKDFGFTQDVVVAVAKNCNRKSMDKLDATLVEYYKKSALSLAEIEHYQTEKQHYTQLAISVNRALGLYYQSVDAIVDEYVVGWVSKGYDDETLLAIAKYAFRSGVRTLAGFAKVIDKLYKNGITTLVALDGYLQSIAAQDELIKEVLQNAGLERNVTNNDRALYRTWTALWNMPQEVICFVAQKSAGSVSPTAYVNKVLSAYKQKGIFSLAQAQAEKQSTATEAPVKRAVIGKDLERRVYTDEQLNSLFTALDETED